MAKLGKKEILSNYVKSLSRKNAASNALNRTKQSHVPALDKAGYIRENGIDREDRDDYINNPKEFNRKVGNTITNNLGGYARYLNAERRRKENRPVATKEYMLRQSLEEQKNDRNIRTKRKGR